MKERKIISVEEFEKKGRRSFLTGLGAATVGVAGITGLNVTPDRRIPSVMRSVMDFNGDLWQALYREQALAPTFDHSEAEDLIFNGRWGVRDSEGEPLPLDLDSYRVCLLYTSDAADE